MASKERVELIDGSGIKSRKKRLVVANKVIIKPRGKKSHTPSYRASFTEKCFLYYTRGIWPFKWMTRKLLLIDGMDECISFEKNNVSTGRYDIAEHFEEEVYKKASSVKTKMEMPFFFTMVLVFLIILQVVSILVMTGRITI